MSHAKLLKNIQKRQEMMDILGKLGFNQKLALYKTAYNSVAGCYVGIKECVIYKDRNGNTMPILRCRVKDVDRDVWFRPEDLNSYCL